MYKIVYDHWPQNVCKNLKKYYNIKYEKRVNGNFCYN